MMTWAMQHKRLFWIVVVGLLLTGAAVAVRATNLLGTERIESYHAPIYASDGRSVYFVRRNAEGLVWGLGIEHFTPPASIRIDSDLIALCRLDLASGRTEVLQSWDRTPATGRTIKSYRGSLFQVLRARLTEPEPGIISYSVRLTIHKIPSSEQHQLTGRWPSTETSSPGWTAATAQAIVPEADLMVLAQRELMVLPRYRLYPVALAEHDHDRDMTTILQKSPAFADHYPEDIPPQEIAEASRHSEVIHLRDMANTRQQLLEAFHREGLNEGDAALKTIDEMRRLGYYPMPTTITAVEISAEQSHLQALSLIEIADAEMASGVFPDIEKAIAAPGTAVEKNMGKYIIHRDHQNSRRLNSLLSEEVKQFRVRFKNRSYLISIHDPGEGRG